MLSRLKRRTPSSSLVDADLDSAADDYIDQAQQQAANGAAPASPTPSHRSRGDKNASASAGHLAAASASANGRTLSPARASNGRASRSSSFGSFVEKRPTSLLVPEGLNGYRGGASGGGQDGGSVANIGKGSLTLDHLDSTSSNGNARAPELLVVSDGLQSRDSLDSTDLRTPVPGQQDAYFYPSATSSTTTSSMATGGTRSRSNTTNGEAPSGLSALAGLNSPSGGAATLDPNSNTSGPPSRSSSRQGSRSSSVNSQQYPDSLSLRPPVSGASPASRPTMKKQRSMQGGIAGALAYSGVALASPSPSMRQPLNLARVPTAGSGTLSARDSYEGSEDGRSEYGDGTLVSVDQLGDFDDVVSQLGTGYAVASSKRNAEFHAIFKNIPDDDYLIEDYGCALQREILIQGRLYISEHHLSFNANIFGWVTTLTLPFAEVVSIEKRMTAYVIPNAIQVTTLHARHTFASFLSRDTTYDLIGNIWRMVHPVVPASAALPDSAQHDSDDENDHRNDADGRSMDSHDHEDDVPATTKPKKKRLRGLRRRGDTGASSEGGKGGGGAAQGALGASGSPRNGTPRAETKVHPITTDSCPTLKDLKEVAMDSVFPSAPEKIYNLMFTSGFMKDFWSENQKLLELQISDWAPEKSGSNLLARSMSYIKPLNGSIGPKQTKCLITDESAHVDFDDFVCVITTTRTPDVPSGGSFSVKTRTSMTWAKGNSCRVVVTTGVEWTGRSFVKGIIDRSCIEGQKTYHADLEKAMRHYIQQHRSEFLEEGQDVDAQSVADTASLTDGGGGSSTRATDALDSTGDVNKKEDGRGGPITTVLRAIAGTLSDLVGGLSPTSAGLAFVVLVLVLSNLWTLASRPTSGSVSPGSRTSRAPPSRHGSDRTPDQVALAVRDVLRDYFNDAAAGGHAGGAAGAGTSEGAVSPKVPLDPKAEAEETRALLDGLQERIARLRGALEHVE